MKTNNLYLAGLAAAILCANVGDALANPRAAEASGADFIVAADDLTGWHVGGFYRYDSTASLRSPSTTRTWRSSTAAGRGSTSSTRTF